MKTYYTYILASKKHGTIYIGITSNLVRRTWQHKNSVASGFTSKYNVTKLVYFEQYNDVNNAIEREKYLKGKKRDFKIKLIEEKNPEWKDLYNDIK